MVITPTIRFIIHCAIAAAVIAIASTELMAQLNDFCGIYTAAQNIGSAKGHGYRLPSEGTINALVLFVDFSDDSYPDPEWVVKPATAQYDPSQWGPKYLNDFIDRSTYDPPYFPSRKKYNITTYFDTMSFGKLHIIGHPVYRQAPHPLSWYLNNGATSGNIPASATRDVIQEMDSSWDFAEFDHWTRIRDSVTREYSYVNIPDGDLDLVIVLFRTEYTRPNNGFYGEGWSNLGNPDQAPIGVTPVMDYSVDYNPSANRRRWIRTVDFGSGVTVCRNIKSFVVEGGHRYPSIEVPAHEIGHYLLGTTEAYSTSPGVWALVGQKNVNVSSFMNAFEREQLGWGDIKTVNISTDDERIVEIKDFGTTGEAYRIVTSQIGQTVRESFLLENHQLLSMYDLVDKTSGGGAGLYILRQWSEFEALEPVCADGRWSWSFQGWVQAPWDTRPYDSAQHLPLYKRGNVNRGTGAGGQTDRMLIRWQTSPSVYGQEFIWAWVAEINPYADGEDHIVNAGMPRHFGDGKDYWTPLDYSADLPGNNMFSPWSNPNSERSDGYSTGIGVEVVATGVGMSGKDVRVKFYLTNPKNGPPSKPQMVAIAPTHSEYVPPDTFATGSRLSWSQNLEPDLAGYEIWRTSNESNYTTWAHVADAPRDSTDYDSYYLEPWLSGVHGYLYRIRAKDSSGKYSTFSDPCAFSTNLTTGFWKHSLRSNLQMNRLMVVARPNPFKGNTSLVFDVPSDGSAEMSIHDLLGRRVAVVLDEFRHAGLNSVAFDASNLSPGTYTCLLKVGANLCSTRIIVTP